MSQLDAITDVHEHPVVILPITEGTVRELLDSSDAQSWFETAQRLHVVCVYLLGIVPKLASKPQKAAQLLQSSLNDLLKQLDTPAALADFRVLAAQAFRPAQVEEGLKLLSSLRVDLQRSKEWDVPSALNADGTLNGDFNAEIVNRRLGKSFFTDDPVLQSMGLNVDQVRIATAILGDPEEPLQIQGFAGTGKTHMIRGIIRSLPREHTAILAKTAGQLQAMMSDPGLQNVHHFLFGHFARDHLIDAGVSPSIVRGNTARVDYNVSDETIAHVMGYSPIAYLSPSQVAKAVRGVLFKFCESDDSLVTQDHLTFAHQKLSKPEKRQLVRYTQEYWDNLISQEPSEQWQPIRHYHLIKWASMVPKRRVGELRVSDDEYPPLDLKFAIVDEAHDLTPALAKLLNNSGVAVYSLGDTFQRIEGVPPAMSSSILRREMSFSMRAGEGISRVINPVLEAHPRFREMATLKGSKEIETNCQFYTVRRIPQTPYAILCGSHFHCFEYLHQLVADGATVSLLPGTAYGFESFIISLFRLWRGYRGSSPELFRFRDWDALRASYGRMQVFSRIESMLEKGYSEADFRNVLAKVKPIGKANYTLGRAEDSKNWQFPNVMLSPELFSPDKSAQYVAGNLSKVYLAASRAQRSLALPSSFDEWVENEKRIQG